MTDPLRPLRRLDAALKLGLDLFVCEIHECQALVQQRYCIRVQIMGHEASPGAATQPVFCSMKCAYAFAKDFDGLVSLFDPSLGDLAWVKLGSRHAMSKSFELTAAGLARLEQEDGRG